MSSGSSNFPGTYYATFSHGVPSTPSFFPITLWLTDPTSTATTEGANIAAAAAGVNANILLAFYGSGPTPSGCTEYTNCTTNVGWPENVNSDDGEMAAAKAAGLYVIAGGDPGSNTTAPSVSSALATASAAGATANLIGYIWNDEPPCGTSALEAGHTATEVSAIHGYDNTRMTLIGHASWVTFFNVYPALGVCSGDGGVQEKGSFNAPDLMGFDNYNITNPYESGNSTTCPAGADVLASDFNTRAYDCLWAYGLGVSEAIILQSAQKPFWGYIEVGADNSGESGSLDTFNGSVAGTTALTIVSGIGGITPQCTAAWTGLTVSGTDIPANTTVSGCGSTSSITMNHSATGTTGTETITVTGGLSAGGHAINDCVPANNICVVAGNAYRATAVQVNSAAWMTVISGANGISEFYQDTDAYYFGLGDSADGGSAATAAYNNLKYVNGAIESYASILNAVTSGICSMQNQNLTVSASCSNGILTYATGTSSCPGLAMSKTYSGATWLFVESDRTSMSGGGCASGATFTTTLTGLAGKTATVEYDSNSQYDPSHDSTGNTHSLNGSAQFTDTLGANADSYEVKIYKVQ